MKQAPPVIREIGQFTMGVASAGAAPLTVPAGFGEMGDSVQQQGVVNTGKQMVTGMVNHAIENPVEFTGEMMVAWAGMKGTGEMLKTTDSARYTRYMTQGEVDEALRTGNIPNYGADGVPRPTHLTSEAPLDSAAAAATRYEIGPPTHRATVPASRVRNNGPAPDGRPTTSGGGQQSATPDPIPVKPSEIVPLGD
jgi:hypothetical protein